MPNLLSFQAHTRKTDLKIIKEFELNSHQYLKLVCKTA